jgi:3-isopropylmalate/(R)-2-methylmalate dehydratase large subunit
MSAQTLFDKIWAQHIVRDATPDTPAIVYVDLHLTHEVTSPQAFSVLRERGLKVRRPDLTIATMDHSIPTLAPIQGHYAFVDAQAKTQVTQLETNCKEFGIRLYGLGSDHQGIVHVIGPELGLTQPGKTIVCGDSHTSTHGAFGALAFGIGTTEVGYVLASQCLVQARPKSMEVNVEGQLRKGVTAKDLILAVIAEIGVGGATGHVIEYTGSAIRALSMDERMTVCNMSIEAGARAGMVAPDDTTFQYLAGREFSPKGKDWDKAVARWQTLPSDPGAHYDRRISLNADDIAPMITYGTNPGMGMAISGTVPAIDPEALEYMGFKAGQKLVGVPIQVVFIGSCTNSRISDLRAAAEVFKNRKVAPGVRTLIVPGSQPIKKQAESEGLDKIFLAAGAEWREAGCSMCIAMNGDMVGSGEYAVSTSNRNFKGRQGPNSRTLLASPLTAAAAAVTGVITDVRQLLR